MIFSSDSGDRGVVIDLDTGKKVPMAFWCDTETGQWKSHVVGPDGKELRREDGSPVVMQGKGRIKFVRNAPKSKSLISYDQSVGVYTEVFRQVWRQRGFSLQQVQKRLDAKKRRERCLGGY